MSAPTSHDPIVVNTRDGVVWLRRAVTVDGRALYAMDGAVLGAPEFVLATLADLAERGIAGSADVLPVPVGPGSPFAEVLRAALDRLREEAPERASELYPEERDRIAVLLADTAPATAGLVVAMAETLRDCQEHEHPAYEDIFCGNLRGWMGERAGPLLRRLMDVEAERDGLLARVAELEAGRGPSVQESADKLTRLLAPTQALREDKPADEPPVIVYRAEHPDSGIVLGTYSNREAAVAHCEALATREGATGLVSWVPDTDDDAFSPEELTYFDVEYCDGNDVPVQTCTGYVVTPLEIASAYDEEADE
ncbi:hypothetical protein [Streptomyces alboflavus]|uniref:hypothetical protein n=1 Tax=Streptomyces alboflavus TaxID=67267 RepID=UPI00068C719C|nr:hypothetical protein [Streptomyces alboflavus]